MAQVAALPEWADYVKSHPVGTKLQEPALQLIQAVVRVNNGSSEAHPLVKEYNISTNTGVEYDPLSTASDLMHELGEAEEALKPDLFTWRIAPVAPVLDSSQFWSGVEIPWEVKSSADLIDNM